MLFTYIKNFFNKKIKYHLSVQMMVMTFIIVMFLSAISAYMQIYYEILRTKININENFANLKETNLKFITDAVWDCSDDKILLGLDQLIKERYISYVELEIFENEAIQNKTIYRGKKPDLSLNETQIKSYVLTKNEKEIASIEVISNPNFITNQVLAKLPLIVSITIFLAIVISLSIMLLIHSLVIHNLKFLARQTKYMSLEKMNDLIELPNREDDFFKNELDDLVSSINKMKKSLVLEISENEQKNKALESQKIFSNTLINSCNLIICRLDPEFKIVSINSAATFQTGFLEFEVKGCNWEKIFVIEEQQSKIIKQISSDFHCSISEIPMLDQQGKKLIFQWNFVPIYEGKDLKYHIAFGYDITMLRDAQDRLQESNTLLEYKIEQRTQKLKQTNEELKTAYQNMRETQQQLIESETLASLGSLVAGISHEINTPLGVSVTAQTLIDEKIKEIDKLYKNKNLSDSKIEQFISVITQANEILESNLKRAAELIKSFKQIAVDSSSQTRYSFNIKENLNQTLLSLSNVVKKGHLNINIECDEKFKIDSYPGALTQIYTNLIMNTLNHAYDKNDIKDKNIKISITEQESFFTIVYQDNGNGIDNDILPHIFEPFVTSKRGMGGSGLGGNIIYNLTNKVLGGKIYCENLVAPNHGAKFVITISKNPVNTDKKQILS